MNIKSLNTILSESLINMAPSFLNKLIFVEQCLIRMQQNQGISYSNQIDFFHQKFDIFLRKFNPMDSDNSKALKVEVNKEKAIEYRENVKKFDGLFAESQANFQNSSNATYYIVSTKFIREWRQFCESLDNNRIEPQQMNHDLLEPATVQLRPGLVQSADFQIIDCKVYEVFQQFSQKGIEIKRIAYFLHGEKKVPVYVDKISYIVFRQNDLQNIDRKRIKVDDLRLKELKKISKNNTIQDLLYSIHETQSMGKKYQLRCWLNKGNMDMAQLYNYISKETQPLSYWDMKIKGVGKQIQDEKIPLNDCAMEEQDYFIIEAADYGKWFFRAADEAKCEGCFKIKKITHPCGCKKVGYCSADCQEKDVQYHSKYCSFMEEQELNKKIEMVITDRSAKGLVGLSNLGNTCFMNSCLQCLSHTLPLTSYFIQGHYQPEINKINPLGTKGKLAKAYATFIKNMWCEQSHTYSPYRLKSAIASVNQMFSGYAQHDSQELFSFLVDGLHEDLNRIQKKPYIESVDSQGRPDHEVALQSWLAHIQRNQSIIVDLMTGQYKSKVVCPDCKKQSITFDPFITVTLPIPEQPTVNQLSFYVLFHDCLQQTKKMGIVYKKANIQQWIKQATKILDKSPNQFKFYILTFNQNIYDFEKTNNRQLLHKIQSQNKSCFLIQLSKEEQEIMASDLGIQIVCRLSKKMYGDNYESLWFKRPFWFKKDQVTGLAIMKRVLKYLYHEAYDFSPKRYKGSGQPDSFQKYQNKMLSEKRPFQIFLRYNKKIERHYHKTETIFEKQCEIQDDMKVMELVQQLKIADSGDWEIDLRTNKIGYDVYSFDRLKKYSDGTKQKKNDFFQQKAAVSLDQCFQIFEQPEQLEAGNQWYCSGCKDHKLAFKQLTIYKAPQILILHLKRFKSKGILRKQKNDTTVQFPQRLDMSKYVIDPNPINSYIAEVKKQNKYIEPSYQIPVPNCENNKPIYQLYAISNHYGGLGGGHYTAYAKNQNRWHSFNDSSVHQVDQSQINGGGAYILFYKRVV